MRACFNICVFNIVSCSVILDCPKSWRNNFVLKIQIKCDVNCFFSSGKNVAQQPNRGNLRFNIDYVVGIKIRIKIAFMYRYIFGFYIIIAR